MKLKEKVQKAINQFRRQTLNVLYPPLCAHCQTALSKRVPLFCPTCLEQIALIDLQGRCWTCFAELHKGRCDRCIHRPVVVHRQFAACEALGPARTLFNALGNGRRECVAPAASLMAYQWLEQKMPLPDLLIPLPISFWQKQQMGFDAHLMLTQEIGKIFSIPTKSVLRRKFDSRHFLTQGELCFRFQVLRKAQEELCDKRLLLIAPMLDDALFRRIGTELKSFFPAQIDALAFVTN
jgi:predicted amidophosphoribosyltransferase